MFEPAGCLYATPLVQKSSPHADITDIADVEADQVETDVEYAVSCNSLSMISGVHFGVDCM